MNKFLLILLFMFSITSCNFEDEGEDLAGGLFAENKIVEDAFIITEANPKTYLESEVITFQITHPFELTVTGTPRIAIDVGGSSSWATYTSGSGSKTLSFQYSVTAGDLDSDGIQVGNAVDLNGGNIQFNDGTADITVNTTLTSLIMSAVKVDATYPAITGIAPTNLVPILYNKEVAQVLITFDEPVTITGTPQVELTVGASTVYADYALGSGGNLIYFTYQVASTDSDGNGYETVSINLNGGTIKDSAGNNATLTSGSFGDMYIQIDGDTPYVEDITPPADGSYIPGEFVDISLTYTENVVVTGTPRIPIDVGGNTEYANYISGSGTNIHVYRYIVTSGDVDSDGIQISTVLDENSGTIQDLDGGNTNALTDLDAPITSNVLIDGILPAVTTITPPIDATYKFGEELYFTLNFNTNVDVTGFPILKLNLDSSGTPVDVTYNSGSGTTSLVFRYVVVDGHDDPTGIEVDPTLDLNGGTIQNSNLTNANLDLSAAIAVPLDTSAVFVDGTIPSVTSITPPGDDDYEAGTDLDFTVHFNEPVNVTNTPTLKLDIGGNIVDATYQSGTGTSDLIFRYTVIISDLDTDGITFNSTDLILSTATDIQDAALNDVDIDFSTVASSLDLTSVTVDGVLPTIISIAAPADNTYLEGEDLIFTASMSEAIYVTGTPQIELDIGGTTVNAVYDTGHTTSTLTFKYTLPAGLQDLDGITMVTPIQLAGGTMDDGAGNDLNLTYTLPNTSAVNVDSKYPTVLSVTPPIDKTWIKNEVIEFIVNYDEAVNVTFNPKITIDLGGVPTEFLYTGGTGTTSLTFGYTVILDDEDTDGISIPVTLIDLNTTGLLKDDAGNDAGLDLVATAPIPPLGAVLVDGIEATILSVTPPADQTYKIGDSMDFQVQFSEVVNVTNTPQLEITLTSGTVYANYLLGTGTDTLTFSYIVLANDDDLAAGGIELVSPLSYNGANTNLQDSSGNDLDMSFTPPSTINIHVDGIVPTVTIDPSLSIIDTNKLTYTISGTCSDDTEIVTVNVGGVTDTPTCSAGVYTTTNMDVSGVTESASNTIADVSITADHSDAAGNPAIQATDTVISDITIPTVTTNTISAQTYMIGDIVDVAVNFNENVTVTGTPRIQLSFDTQFSTPIYANYVSGDGTSTLVFQYTIVEGDEDVTGIQSLGTIDPNGGSIIDANTNESDYTLPSTNYAGALVDGIKATITNITATANTYIVGEDIDFTITFSENVTNTNDNARLEVSMEAQNTTPLYATYVSGSGTASHTYRYTVIAGDEDSNGITLSSDLELNTDSLTDDAGNDIDLTNSFTTHPGVLVDAVLPTVTITSSSTIIDTNKTAYTISGTCSENGRNVSIDIAGVTDSPVCIANAFTTSALDVSAVSESVSNTVADINITADHDDASGNSAVQATDIVIKDTIIPTISTNTIPTTSYKIGDTVTITVDFSENVIVTGSPRIELSMDTQATTPIYATYSAGDGTSTLTFEYIVQEGDEDINGIASNSLIDPNSGSITDTNLNLADYNLNSTVYGGVMIDGIKPTISSITIAPATYIGSDNLDITITYSESVDIVGGTPEISLNFETAVPTAIAEYQSGTGTDTLLFRYTILSGNEDTDGIDLNSAITIAGTTIKDAQGNDAYLTIPTTNFPAVLVDAIVPTVDIITADTIELSNQTTYTVSGNCSDNGELVSVDVGGVTDTPTCTAGIYTTASLDVSGVADGPAILVTADHQDAASNNAIQATLNIIKDTTIPTVSSNTISAITHKIGDSINLVVNYDENVLVTGSPRIQLNLDSGNVYADYTSGDGTSALTFSYTVVENDEDLDNISSAAIIEANSGTIKDLYGNETDYNLANSTYAGSLVDGVKATITNITASSNTYIIGDDIDFTVTYSENVTASSTNSRIQMVMETQNTTPLYATYVSGSGTTSHVYRYNVAAGDEDTNGVTLAGTIDLNLDSLTDDAGNDINLSNSFTTHAGVLVDAIIPTIAIDSLLTINDANKAAYTVSGTCSENGQIVSIDVGGVTDTPTCTTNTFSTSIDVTAASDSLTLLITADLDDSSGNSAVQATTNVIKDTVIPTVSTNTIAANTYKIGDVITVTASFNEDVTVTGTPQVQLTLDSGNVNADYTSGDGTSTLTFEYTVLENDEELTVINSAASITLNGGTIVDANDNPSDYLLTSTSFAGTTIDGVKATITNITAAGNTYVSGDDIDFTITFSENVTNTNDNARVEISMETQNSTPLYATYVSGSGTSTHTYRYSVTTGDDDINGIALAGTVDLNTDSLKDDAGNDIALTNTFTAFASVLVDAVVPTVTLDTIDTINDANKTAYTVSGTCSDNGQFVSISVGGVVDTPICSANAYSILMNVSLASDSPSLLVTADLNDAAGNSAAQATTNVIKDTVIPTVSTNTITANTYKIGDVITVTASFNEDVTVTGTPQVQLTLDSGNVNADYTSGDGTSTLTFEYTVLENDEELTVINSAASITLNGGTIVDANDNPSDYLLTSTSFAGTTIDGVKATITNITSSASTYVASDNVDFTVTYSENVTASSTNSRIQLSMETQNTTPLYATYVSGSGTTTHLYRYNVTAGDEDTNGVALATSIDLNSDSLTDDAGNDIDLTNSFTSFASVLVDAIVPTVTIDAATTINTANKLAYTLTGTCSDNTRTVTVDIGGVSATPTCSGGTWSTGAIDVTAASDSATLAITADHDDSAGNNAIQASTTIIKDTIDPTVSTNTVAGVTYVIGDTVPVVVNFNENVTVTGTPRIQLSFDTAASAPVYANYVSGDGTSSLTFEYTVVAGDEDTNGFGGNSAIDPNSGTIKDANDNLTDYVLPTTVYAGTVIDGLGPQISSLLITNATYVGGEDIDIVLTYDDNVYIAGGTPDIPLTFDTAVGSPKAVYVSGHGTNTLTFRYNIISGNEDLSGIDIAANISLTATTIKDTNGNDAELTLSPTHHAGVLIDAIVPLVSITSTTTVNDANKASYVVSGTCSDNGQVVVVDIGGVTSSPSCSSGSFSTTGMNLSALSDSATLLIEADHQDIAGNDAVTASTNVIKDTVLPDVSTNTLTANTYKIGDMITVTANFAENVTVSGSPQIPLNLDSGTVNAIYSSGSPGTTLTFTYTVVENDEETTIISSAAAIDPNSGSIIDDNGNESSYALNSTSFTGTSVDGVKATISNITATGNTYIIGDNIDFTVTYSENVSVSNSNARIQLTMETQNTTPLYAIYISGSGTTSHVYRYTVTAGDEDTNGVALAASIDLNSDTLTDDAGNDINLANSFTAHGSVLVDALVPTVTIDAASTINTANKSAYTLTGNCSENTRTVTVDIGGVSATPTCSGGTWSTGAIDVTGASDSATLAITADHDDSAGNNAVQATTTVIKDTVDPTVAITSSPTINTANKASYVVSGTCSENSVTVTIDVGGVTNTPTCSGGNFTTSSMDVTGVSDSGTVAITADQTDSNLNPATQATTTVIKDTLDPTVAITSSPDANLATEGSYTLSGTCSENGEDVSYDIDSGTITGTVSCSGGSWTTGAIDISSASNSATLPITADHTDTNLNPAVQATTTIIKDSDIPVIAITSTTTANIANESSYIVSGTCSENGEIVTIDIGSVQSTPTCSGGSFTTAGMNISGESDSASLTVTASHDDINGNPATQSSISIIKDTIAPTLSGTTIPGVTFEDGDNLDITVTFNDNVTVTGTPRIQVNLTSGSRYATYLSGDGTNTLVFRYTVATSDSDSDGLTTDTSIDDNGGSILDDNGNTASHALAVIAFPSSYVDAVAPSISGTTKPTDGVYLESDNLDFVVTYDENITVSGTPRIQVTIGGSTEYANYESGSGSTSLIFRYTIQAGDEDLDGIAYATSVDLNSGTIKDSSNNDADLFIGASSTGNVDVDAVVPTVAITSSDNINVGNETTYQVSGTCSDDGQAVVVYVGVISDSPNCSGGVFTTSNINVSGLADGPVTITADHDDSAGNSATQVSTSVNKDTSAPTISNISMSTSAGSYSTGNIDISVTMTKAVNITVATPRIQLNIGGTTVYADYNSGSGSSSLTFRYTIQAGDFDMDGIAVTGSSIDLNGATMQDASLNDATPLTFSAPDASGINVVFSGLAAWFDASDSSTVTHSSNDISQWADKSGNNYHANQSTASYKPEYVTNAVNGQDVVRFDGTDDFFSDNHSYTARTVLIVYMVDSVSQDNNEIGQLWGNYTDAAHVAVNPNTGLSEGFSFNGDGLTTARYQLDGSSFTGYVQDTTAIQWNYDSYHLGYVEFSSGQSMSKQVIGAQEQGSPGTNQLGGDIAEIIIFSGTLDATQRSTIKSYLNNKYNIY